MSRRRSAGFAVALLLLVGAVPTLGWLGLHIIRNSRAGTLVTRESDARAPGYEAIVDPTPTALLIQKGAKGQMVALTFLALGRTGGGGSAMFLPTDTALAPPANPGDRYVTAYVTGGQDGVEKQVGRTLNAGIGAVIEMDDDKWAALTANTAPIQIDNPDAISAGSFRFAAGPIELRPEQVGPYLSALDDGESELNRLNRSQLFWQAWLKRVSASKAADVIPGEAKAGIGFFLRTMAQGPVRLEPMPVKPQPLPGLANATQFVPVAGQIRKDVVDTVPFPTAPSPGARVSVRLLNGVDGEPIPSRLVRKLVLGGATISVLGNDRRFGRATTLIQYRAPAARGAASLVQQALGGQGRVVRNVQASDAVDLTVVLGRDVLPAGRTTSTVTPSSNGGATITTTTRSSADGG